MDAAFVKTSLGQVVDRPLYRLARVKEGNCRTVCYRSLREEDPKNPAWKKLPARILPPDITERETAILLSDWHVAGKINWSAHEKAGYVHYMVVDLGMSLDDVAPCMRTSKSSVQRFKDAYNFMVDTFLTIDNKKYSKDPGMESLASSGDLMPE